MSSYTAIARRYRPQVFEDVVGQDHIAKTLCNAIKENKVSHAYLFAGSRGIGKTTMARIFAKSLNCQKGPTGTPCNKCEICRAVSEGVDPDVIEMDAASNRGIEEIRTLRESVGYVPLRARYKIYIVDEAHQLTREAFNALLKTLEEPPPHVKFIFVTTEPHKFPDTIISRCQRFNFRRIPTQAIYKELKKVCSKENVGHDEGTLSIIAQLVSGSMRDAQSILDQLISFSGNKITLSHTESLLGAITQDEMFSLIDAVLQKDLSQIIQLVDTAFAQGKDLGVLFDQLIGHMWRLILVLINPRDSNLLKEEIIQERERYETQARKFTLELLLSYSTYLAETRAKLKDTSNPRVMVELLFLKLAYLPCTTGDSPEPNHAPQRVHGKYQGREPKVVHEVVHRSPNEKPIQNLPEPAKVTQPASDTPPVKKLSPSPATIKDKTDNTLPVNEVGVPEKPDEREEAEVDLTEGKDFKEIWSKIVEEIHKTSVKVYGVLREGQFVRADKQEIIVGFDPQHSFHKSMVESPDYKKVIESSIIKITGQHISFSTTQTERNESTTQSMVNDKEIREAQPDYFVRRDVAPDIEKDSRKKDLVKELLNNPIIRKIKEDFDGRIIDVEGEI